MNDLHTPPRGESWRWDSLLMLLNVPSDLVTFGACVVVMAVAAQIYRLGTLKTTELAYPQLWRVGALFMLFFGLSRIGSLLEIWYGGRMYLLTGINRVLMAATSAWFAVLIWRSRSGMILVGKVMKEIEKQTGEESSNVRSRVVGPRDSD